MRNFHIEVVALDTNQVPSLLKLKICEVVKFLS